MYYVIEVRAARRFTLVQAAAPDRIVWSDLWRFDRSYWYIVGLCVTFYSVIFPFRSTFAIKYFQHAHGLSLQEAGAMNGYVFLAAIFATPLFGLMVDRVGHRAFVHGVRHRAPGGHVSDPRIHEPELVGQTVLIGIAFSLVPAVLWPAVPYVVAAERLGTAYGLMTMLQNIGMMVCQPRGGQAERRSGAGPDNPAGYLPMLWMFCLLSLFGFVFAAALRKRETGPESHGLESIRAAAA